jgi:hypothetical protein
VASVWQFVFAAAGNFDGDFTRCSGHLDVWSGGLADERLHGGVGSCCV